MNYTVQFDELEGIPHQGMLADLMANSSMVQKTWVDISFHPEEQWLKIWFSNVLTAEDEDVLTGLILQCLAVRKFIQASGSEYFELMEIHEKRWQRHTRRVSFGVEFPDVPTVSILNAVFDGAANIEIVNITKKWFDFRVTAVAGRRSIMGFTSIEFDWEARKWVA